MRRWASVFILILVANLLFCEFVFAESILTKISISHRGGGIACNSETNKVYVGSSDSIISNLISNMLSIIDGITHTVETTVDFAISAFDVNVAVNEATNKIYVLNGVDMVHRADTIFVLDGSTNTIEKTIDVGFPAQVGVNKVTNKVYVNNLGGFGKVGVIDGETNILSSTIDLMIQATPVAIAVNSNTNKIYVADNLHAVCVIDGASNTVVDIIGADTESSINTPISLAVNTSTNKVYISDESANKINVVDGNTNQVVAVINIMSPLGLAVNSQTNRIYVYDNVMNAVCVIDGVTNKVVDVIILGGKPNGVAVNEKTNKIYLSNSVNKNVVVLDGSVTAPNLIIDQVKDAINELSVTQGLLIQGPLSKKLGVLIKKLEILLDSRINKCKKASRLVLKQMEKTINKIENVDVPSLRENDDSMIDKTTDNCIPPEFFDEKHIPLQESYSIIQSAFIIDEDNDKVPDLCER